MQKTPLFLFFILTLTACQKSEFTNESESGNSVVKYSVAFGQSDDTKGTLINTSGIEASLSSFHQTVGTFSATAFRDGAAEPLFSQSVSWSDADSKWVGSPVAYWPQSSVLNFFASANMPSISVATASCTSSAVTLNYLAVPANVTDQKDILLGCYQGDGGKTGTADIHFKHPLTSFVFKRGSHNIDEDMISIKQISISGIAASGSVAMDVTGNLSAWSVSGYTGMATLGDGTSDLAVNSTTGVIGGTNGTFIIIPQNAASNNITVSVKAQTLDGSKTYTTTIATGDFLAGKTYEFSIYPNATRWLEIAYKCPWDSEVTL